MHRCNDQVAQRRYILSWFIPVSLMSALARVALAGTQNSLTRPWPLPSSQTAFLRASMFTLPAAVAVTLAGGSYRSPGPNVSVLFGA